MRDKTPPPPQNPAEVAREAFSRLARSRIAPTPDNYRDVYNEIVGIAAESSAETVMANFAKLLTTMPAPNNPESISLRREVSMMRFS